MNIPTLSADMITRRAGDIRRSNFYVSSSDGNYSPFDEPSMKALITSIVEAVNTSIAEINYQTATIASDGLTHLCCWDASRGWIPVCQRLNELAVAPAPTCVACSGHAKR